MTGPRQDFCAYPPCNAPVQPPHLKYCSDAHRKANARLRYDEGANLRGTDDRVEREAKKLLEEESRKELKSLARYEVKRQRYMDYIADIIKPFEMSEPQPFPAHQKGSSVDWAIEISDWHVGQLTPIEHTGGMYEQTSDITRQQVDSLLHAVSLIYHEAEGKKVKRIWVPTLGDLMENDHMRPSQLRQTDLPVTKQVLYTYDLLTYFLRSLLGIPGLEEIIVDNIGGNHDRTTAKPGNAGLGEADYVDTFAFLLGGFLERAFEFEPRITVVNWETFFGTREFGGLKHVFEHGASFRTSGGSYGGIPWYPIHNAARQYESMLGGVDIVWLGHYHVPYNIPLGQGGWVIGNGALPATSHYAQSRYKALRRPQQWLVEFHRTVGATKFEPLYADIGLPAPGEVWQK